MLCSFLIAVIWSASITTVFPVVKIVLEGETVESWLRHEIENGERIQRELQHEITQLAESLNSASSDEAVLLTNKLDLKKNRLAAEVKSLDWYHKSEPFLNRWAPDTAFQTLVVALVWLLGVSVVKGGLLVLGAILDARVANRTVMDMRRMFYRKALNLDQRRIEMVGTSNMMTHLSYNMMMISSGLQVFYGKCIREPLKMISCLAVAAWISWPLLLMSLLVTPAGLFLIHSVSRRMKRSTQTELSGMTDVFQTLMETFNAVKTVRIFNRELAEQRRFRKNALSLYRMSVRIALYDSLLRPITEILSILAIASSMLIGAYLVLNQETSIFHIQISSTPIKPATLLLFYAMLAGAADPVRKMSEIVNSLVRAGTACDNLLRTFDREPQVASPAKPVPVPEHADSIQFEDVIFTYLPRQPVIRKLNLTVPYRQTVAIVGGNGSGKSTLMNLLTRFYDPHAGRVLIDGQDIRQMNPRKVRRQMAWVTQESVLFRGTVWENIVYSAPQASELEVMRAASMAGVDRFMESLQDGYQTQVGDEGKKLSAGQRQRITLARAILANPRILILDEATSQVDGHAENLILDQMTEFIKQRTTFIITHRPTSLKLADRVIVMELGRIVHDGPLDEAAGRSLEFQNLFHKSA